MAALIFSMGMIFGYALALARRDHIRRVTGK